MPSGGDVQEPAADPAIGDLLGWAGKVFYWIFWPIGISLYWLVYYVCLAVVSVVRVLYRPLEFLLLPVFYLLKFIFDCMIAPFQFLAKFETLYIYLGIAALVGIGLGLLISLTYETLRKPLGLDESQDNNSKPQSQSRTAKEYRSERRKRKSKAEAPLMTAGYLSPGSISLSDSTRRARNKGLVSQTIMEEMDSDY